MPFLGNSPSEVYKSVAKQVITGTGALSYALDNTVTSANELEVFVNNVRQEPGTTYTASGALITFTDALLSTDSCYVIFQGRAVTSNVIQSQNLQDGAVTPAKLDRSYVNKTGDTMSGVHRHNSYLAIGKGGSNNDQITWNAIPDNAGGYTPQWAGSGDAGGAIMGLPYGGGGGLEIRTLRHGTDGAMKSLSSYPVRMYIDDYGRVTMPYQPSWHYTGGTTITTTGYVTIKPSTAVISSPHYDTSSGRFTAPVAGTYFFGVWGLLYPADSADTWNALFAKNGSTVGHLIQGGGNSTNHSSYSAQLIIKMNIGDYVEFQLLTSNNGINAYSSQWNQFGYLIG